MKHIRSFAVFVTEPSPRLPLPEFRCDKMWDAYNNRWQCTLPSWHTSPHCFVEQDEVDHKHYHHFVDDAGNTVCNPTEACEECGRTAPAAKKWEPLL